MGSLAARTRDAIREEPFLFEALAAGVVNYTAAARYLGVADDEEAVATALRRFEDDLTVETGTRDARVTMESGVAFVDDADDAVAAAGSVDLAPGGTHTALLARGAVDPAALRSVLNRLSTAGIEVEAAGVGGDALVVVVDRRSGPDALVVVEESIESVRTVEVGDRGDGNR